MNQPDLSYNPPFGFVYDEDAIGLNLPVTVSEIEEEIKASNPNKAPGPDGFNAHFFKFFWPIIGNYVCDAIIDFFQHGMMLNQLKATFIVLVPKSVAANSLDQFRPISLTNELYKIITRILVQRLKLVIGKFLSPMQSTFVPGRSIVDNIFAAQDLIHNFHLLRETPCMCVKIDLATAYDSVRLEFLEAALKCSRFPTHFIKLIMACVSDAHYLILVNGSSKGYFKGMGGLRQGCPLSPFLFAIVMEFFSTLMTRYDSSELIPTPFQKNQVAISHLMFADDLFVFAKLQMLLLLTLSTS